MTPVARYYTVFDAGVSPRVGFAPALHKVSLKRWGDKRDKKIFHLSWGGDFEQYTVYLGKS